MTLSGLPVHVDRHLCQRFFLRWARPHRKARIAKKWRKRYGALYTPCPGRMYEIRGLGIVTCPCGKALLEKHFPPAPPKENP